MSTSLPFQGEGDALSSPHFLFGAAPSCNSRVPPATISRWSMEGGKACEITAIGPDVTAIADKMKIGSTWRIAGDGSQTSAGMQIKMFDGKWVSDETTAEAKPAADTPPPPDKPAISFADLMEKIPKDRYPAKGQRWDSAVTARVNDWAAQNLVGQEVTLMLPYLQSEPRQEGRYMMSTGVQEFDHAQFHYQVTVRAEFGQDCLPQAGKLKRGDKVKVTGKIRKAQFSESIGDGNLALTLETSTF